MTSFKTEVCSGSNYPLEVTRLIQEVEMATSLDDHGTSPSITGQLVLNFDVALDAKIASSLKEIIQKTQTSENGSNRKRRRLKKMIDSFAEDGSVTRSLNTSG